MPDQLKNTTPGWLRGDPRGGKATESERAAAFTRYDTTALAAAQGPITFYGDGLTEPTNPGGWGCWGWVALDAAGTEIASAYGCLGRAPTMTNNLAEYEALLQATRWALDQGLTGITLRGDSQLVVEQTAGRWACRAANLRPLCAELRTRVRALGATIEWIPREQNTRADSLSRRAYREARRGATQ